MFITHTGTVAAVSRIGSQAFRGISEKMHNIGDNVAKNSGRDLKGTLPTAATHLTQNCNRTFKREATTCGVHIGRCRTFC